MPASETVARSGQARTTIVLAILLLLGGSAAWFWLLPVTQPDLSLGRVIAERFLEQLQNGQAAEAWTSTTAEFKSAQGQESFVRELSAQMLPPGPLDFVSMLTVEVASQSRSEYLFRTTTGETIRIVLGREDGLWKVDRWVRSS